MTWDVRRFYAPPEKFDGYNIRLDEHETRHLRNVLRLREGDHVRVFDGRGGEYESRIEAVGKNETLLTRLRAVEPSSPESPLVLTVAAAILPGEKFEITVQKAVELGVHRFQPMHTSRCEVKPGGSQRRLERWRKIALGAAKQTGRATLMEIFSPAPLDEVIESIRPGTNAIFFSERRGTGFESVRPAPEMTAFFGPKGGWEDSELELASAAGLAIITFGGRIMRAETAAIAMTAILQHRFGDLS